MGIHTPLRIWWGADIAGFPKCKRHYLSEGPELGCEISVWMGDDITEIQQWKNRDK